ncbi:MAG TPA: adenosylmethionine--8-amino-7-oxononanoate transaminase [Candidatus Brocadiia bacterium]|nr:adenosylmethionine--8-amino-7-oxononanoate transaminase [Candidatus Brocadiales bacterium]
MQEYQKQLEAWDKAYLWHPFTQMQEYLKEQPLIIEEGQGAILKDIYGKEYIDGISSMWCNIHGHRKKEIDDAIKAQLDRIAHTTLLGPSNIPAIELAKKLVDISPRGLNKVFYSDNGSTAVEVAIKMAFQYWQHKSPKSPIPPLIKGEKGGLGEVGGIKTKTKFVALQNAYHGDTIGTVSVGGIPIFHKMFQPLLFDTFFAPSPYCYRCPVGKTPSAPPQSPPSQGGDYGGVKNNSKSYCSMDCLDALEEILSKNAPEIAAVILEPLVQGAGGMIVHPKGYLTGVRNLCTKYNVLLIADEVLTGFGRTGRMFACLHENVTPDIMALSKGINGGYMPLAATLTTDEVYNAFLGEYKEFKTFFHGHTYTGNPLACAAANASIEIFEKEKVLEKLKPKIQFLEQRLREFATLMHVGDVRQCGLIAGIELVRDKETKEPFTWEERISVKVSLEARRRGLFIRPLGNVIVIMPPLCIGIDQLSRMMDIIFESIRQVIGDR